MSTTSDRLIVRIDQMPDRSYEVYTTDDVNKASGRHRKRHRRRYKTWMGAFRDAIRRAQVEGCSVEATWVKRGMEA